MKTLEYQMSKELFDTLLKTRKSEAQKKMNPYTYVMGIINEEYGLKGTVTRVSISL